jgi:acetyl esterase/lipase
MANNQLMKIIPNSSVRGAIGHLIGHADEYGIEPSRVAVWGEAAGGYLVSLTGLSDPRIRRRRAQRPAISPVRCSRSARRCTAAQVR